MAVEIPREVAASICAKIREENRGRPPSDPQALQCRNCMACCNGAVFKSCGRACCQVRRRYVRIVALSA